MKSEKRQQMIKNYLDGTNSNEELRELILLKKNSPEFEHEMELALFLREKDKKDLKKIFLQKEEPKKLTRPIALIAASIVALAVFSFIVITNNNLTNYVKNQIKEDVTSPVVLLSASSENITWKKAIELYQKEALFEFTELVQKEIGEKNLNSQQLLFLGLAHLKLGNSKKSIELFERLNNNKDSFSEESSWFLALSLIMENEKNQAKVILQNLISENSYRTVEAQELLRQMK